MAHHTIYFIPLCTSFLIFYTFMYIILDILYLYAHYTRYFIPLCTSHYIFYTWMPAQLDSGHRLVTITAIIWTIKENFCLLSPKTETRDPRLRPQIIIPVKYGFLLVEVSRLVLYIIDVLMDNGSNILAKCAILLLLLSFLAF